MKAFITVIWLAGWSLAAGAHPATKPGDTSRKASSLQVDIRDMPMVLARPANVLFPARLAGHEAEAMDYVRRFAEQRREYLIRTYKKGKQYFPKVLKVFKKYQVPEEFRVLLALESGFNAKAISSAGAVGYWQIMDEVAKEYGMSITEKQRNQKAVTKKGRKGNYKKSVRETLQPVPAKPVVDDRTHFLKSTQVAARYIRDRMRNLEDDWLLIAASYNCGVGNVWQAMQKSGKVNPTFWDIRDRLPAETQAYVMNFIALNVIFHNYDNFVRNQVCWEDEYCIDDTGMAKEPKPVISETSLALAFVR